MGSNQERVRAGSPAWSLVARRVIARVVDCQPGELLPSALAAAQFFCLMFGYFILRPLRETMGLRGGEAHVQSLFQITAVVMLVAVPVYGLVASRVRRGVLVPGAYAFSIVCLAAFLVGMIAIPEADRAWLGDAYYIWLSVFNMFIVSVFWQLLADVFTLEQSKRLFGFIGVGGTAGAIAGSAYAWTLSERIGPSGLIASGGVLIALSMGVAVVLCRRGGPGRGAREASPSSIGGALGGSAFAGLRRMVTSRYLGAIGLVVLLFALTSTLLYFEKLRLVAAEAESDADRTALFALITLCAQIGTITLQLLLTGRLMRWLGVGTLLAVVPVISVVGFAALDLAGSIVVYTVFEATRSAANYALSKPARETLYTVVAREDKYKTKAGIDMFVYRGGDLAGSFVYGLVARAGAAVSVLAVPLGLAGITLAWWLGRAERQLAGDDACEGDGANFQQCGIQGTVDSQGTEREQHATIAS